MATLPIVKIDPPGHYVELDSDVLFLGRDSRLAALIPALQGRGVSTRHCVVRRHGRRWVLEDLGSTNGTWFDGRAVTEKLALRTGDVFTLGEGGPRVSCVAGFGGHTHDRLKRTTVAASPSPSKTKVVDPSDARTELIAPAEGPRPAHASAGAGDGSSVRPFRVTGAPTVRLVRRKTGEELAASGQRVVIGRDPEAAQIVIRADDERHVSGRHAEIAFCLDGRAVVRDLGSRNGTWLNDIPLEAEAPLEVGDTLTLGNAPTVLVVAALEL